MTFLEQSLTSSAKIKKTLDSLTSEIMPVTILHHKKN